MFWMLLRGFDEGLPLTAEAVEVIHQIAAHEGLHRGVDVVQIDLLLDGLFTVYVGVELRHGRHVGRDGRGDFGPTVNCAEECEKILREERRIVVAGAILKDHGDAARGADAGNLRRREGKRQAIADAHELALDIGLNFLDLLFF
jgi:hypothetical protein